MQTKHAQRKPLTIIVALFILAVVVAAATLGYFWYRKTTDAQQQAQTTESQGGSISFDAAERVETETLQTALVLPSAANKEGDTIQLSALTITAPKTWRTVNAKTLLNTPVDSVYATDRNDILAQLVMVPERQPADPMQTTNSLSLYNITKWLAQPTRTATGTVTPASKAAFIENIKNIARGQATNPKACDKGFGVLNTALCGQLLKGTPIATSDGTLTGVAFLGATAQTISYDPQVQVYLVGQAKDQQLLMYGSFHLLDNNSRRLNAQDTDAIKAAWDSLISGNVPTDTMTLFNHVTTAIKSIIITVN